MNDGNDRGKSGTILAGKEFVIVMAVFFSALSFTLGFFVGKKSVKESKDQSPPAVQSVTQNAVSQSAPREMQPVEIDTSRTIADVHVQPGAADGRAAPLNSLAPEQPPPVKERAKNATIEPPKITDASSSLTAVGDNAPSKALARAGYHQITGRYSVQLGALKNAGEAKRLKEKFARKGYMTFITITRLQKKEKVYKVKAGEFRDRKDAELLALKLKKSEGLHAFVTLRNE